MQSKKSIGFPNAYFAITAFALTVFITMPMASAQEIPKNGKELFEGKCARCHGKDGTKGRFGAKNLQLSVLNDAMLFQIISEGKSFMPSWKKKFTAIQIKMIMDYIKTLRKP